MATSPTKPLYVSVIADNPETRDGLRDYLREAGVTTQATGALNDTVAVPRAATAVVIFPDEFGAKEIVASVLSLRTVRPRLLILLVTGVPQRFRAALEPDGRSPLPVILPKPVFGWSILDAIREYAASGSP
jgi:hypothetical protein